HLIPTYMHLLELRKGFSKLLEQFLDVHNAFFTLHIDLKEPFKSSRMPWHINLWQEYTMPIPTIVDQLLKLCYRIIFPCPTGHVLRSGETRIFFTFQSPSNILREMEMQNIELILSHNIDLLF